MWVQAYVGNTDEVERNGSNCRQSTVSLQTLFAADIEYE